MLKVLLETKAPRARSVGGTVTSALVHGAVIAVAIALSVPGVGGAKSTPERRDVLYIYPPSKLEPVSRPDGPRTAAPVGRVEPTLPAFQYASLDSIPIDVAPSTSASEMTESEFDGPGVPTDGALGGSSVPGGSIDGVIDQRYVDRAPRLFGRNEEPRFPAALRQSGRGGRVVMQFAVDTLGRAEMSGLTVIEATDPLFADAVRTVLSRYRFTAGEAGGRKVRTLVQLPFEFTLAR